MKSTKMMLAVILASVAAHAQSCPSSSSLKAMSGGGTSAAGWESGASVTIYIVSNSTTGTFSSDAVNAIETAFSNWNTDLSSGQTGRSPFSLSRKRNE